MKPIDVMRTSQGCVTLSMSVWWFALLLVCLHFLALLLEVGSQNSLVLEAGRSFQTVLIHMQCVVPAGI